MLDADGGIAGGLHDDIHRAARNRPRAVIGKSGGADPRVIPADGAARLAGAIAVEVDDDRHLQPRRVRHLRQKHRAELAGADQRDANRFAGRAAGVEEMGEVHGEKSSEQICVRNAAAFDLSSWPGKSAKRVFTLDVPAIHVSVPLRYQDVDARHPSTPGLRRIQCQSAEALAKAGTRPGMTMQLALRALRYSAACLGARASRSSASSSTVWIGVKSRWAIYSGRVGVRM